MRGKCSVVFSEEFTLERDNFFLKGEDKFYFAEVSVLELSPEANVVVCLFCCFSSQATTMVRAGWSVHLTTLFPGQA